MCVVHYESQKENRTGKKTPHLIIIIQNQIYSSFNEYTQWLRKMFYLQQSQQLIHVYMYNRSTCTLTRYVLYSVHQAFSLPPSLQIMNLKLEDVGAQRSFVFLWCGSCEGLDLGREVREGGREEGGRREEGRKLSGV